MKNIMFFGWEKITEILIYDLRSLEKEGIDISVGNRDTFFNKMYRLSNKFLMNKFFLRR